MYKIHLFFGMFKKILCSKQKTLLPSTFEDTVNEGVAAPVDAALGGNVFHQCMMFFMPFKCLKRKQQQNLSILRKNTTVS